MFKDICLGPFCKSVSLISIYVVFEVLSKNIEFFEKISKERRYWNCVSSFLFFFTCVFNTSLHLWLSLLSYTVINVSDVCSFVVLNDIT